MERKKCTKCNLEKILDEFRLRRNVYGEYRNSQCKECEKNRYSHKCEWCGQEFRDKHKDRKFCSKVCFSKSVDRKIEYKCENCGVEVKVKPFIYNKSEHHYCSDKCMREHRPIWYNGDKIYNFNPNRTREQRQKERKLQLDSQFSREVKKKFNYICQCCWMKGGKLVSHHIDGYNWNEKGRYDIDNGICLCEKCHMEFHKIYGYGNNTKEQLGKFVQQKNNIIIW